MDSIQKRDAARRGCKIAKILHTATILRNGWEMDNEGWIVELEGGKVAALATNHGGVCNWSRADAEEELAEHESAAASIRKALEMWPK